MPILDNQYVEMTDPKQRVKFRVALLKLVEQYPYNDNPMKGELEKQNEASLIRLKASMDDILSQDIPAEDKRKVEKILSNVNTVLLRRQQSVPVAFDALVSDFDPENSCINITKNDGQPYFILAFPEALASTMREIFAPYEYSNEEQQLWARNPETINISKVAIQGQESRVGAALSQAILNKKAEIITSLKEALVQQQQRCSSDATRRNDRKLQQLSSQIQHKLQKLDTLSRSPRAGVVEILRAIDSTSDFTHVVDREIAQFKQDASMKKSTVSYREKLTELVVSSSTHEQRPRHEHSQYEMSNLLTITPRESDSFVTLHVNSDSEVVNRIIREVYEVCESRDPKTFVMAKRGNMIFIDKTLLQENGGRLNQQIKEKFLLQKEQLVGDLRESIKFSMDRCSSDEQRQSSPELTQLRQQGESKLSKLDKLNSPNQIIQFIEETEHYKQSVSEAIKAFKEARSSVKFRP